MRKTVDSGSLFLIVEDKDGNEKSVEIGDTLYGNWPIHGEGPNEGDDMEFVRFEVEV